MSPNILTFLSSHWVNKIHNLQGVRETSLLPDCIPPKLCSCLFSVGRRPLQGQKENNTLVGIFFKVHIVCIAFHRELDFQIHRL